jgi:Ca-activated chloride channel family protein
MRSTPWGRSAPVFAPPAATIGLLVAAAAAAALTAGATPATGPGAAAARLQLIASALESIPEDEGDRTLSPYFFVLSGDPDTDLLPLKSTRAEVNAAGVIADVTLRQTYRNEGQTALEAIYIFPASTRAAVHGMRMTVGERVIEAGIRKRKEAKAVYEKAKATGQTASLLEQQRPNVFQMSVANILPGDEIAVELRYTELLVPEESVYEFVLPAVVGPRYSNVPADGSPETESWVENPYLHAGRPAPFDFAVAACVTGGIPIARLHSPSHEIDVRWEGERVAEVSTTGARDDGNRDFALRWSLAGGRIESGLLTHRAGDERYFLLMLEPPARVAAAEVLPREYVFILDVSGSMAGFPLAVSKRLIADILEGLSPADSFNVLLFAGGSAQLSPESLPATPANVRKGIDWVEAARGGGGTELLPALERAFALPRDEGKSRIVVLATDGYVAVEKRAFDLVKRNLDRANLFPFGIGTSVNRELIEGLARAGLGEPFVVLDGAEAPRQAARFREYVAAPLLRGIEVDARGIGAHDVEPPAVPDLFAGRPLMVFGKYRGDGGSIRVKGRTPAGAWERTVDVSTAAGGEATVALPYLWARHRIRALADMNLLAADDARAREVTRLGLKHHLLTDYTSFVAVDEVVRADGRRKRTVRQPSPLPAGVPDSAVGDAYGYGGLGLAGTGRGGGGTGAGSIGLGSLHTIGHGAGGGSGAGYGLAARSASAPSIRTGTAEVRGSLDRELIRRTIQRQLNALRHCYERELQSNPGLSGRVVVRFVIDADGKVGTALIAETTLNNAKVEKCLLKIFSRMIFPAVPGGGQVQVNYPLTFKSE